MAKKKASKTASKELEKVFLELKKNHLKLTEPRKVIIEALHENHGPFSVEEIHQRFAKTSCDLATVYRTVTSLENARLLKRCEFGDGIARYEWLDQDAAHHHHHLICIECKKVELVEECELESSMDRVAKKRGFKNVSHLLEFFGVCPTCQKLG